MNGRVILRDGELISGLFEFIKLNAKIPNFFKMIDSSPNDHADKITSLKKAILLGDDKNNIFSDNHCSHYLLYLIHNNEIPFWQGVTVYTYLLALMEFTDRQSLKSEDNEAKSIRAINVFSIFINNVLTSEGKAYLKSITYNFNYELNIDINYDSLVNFVSTLSLSEQWVLTIPILYCGHEDILLPVSAGLPFCNIEYKGYSSRSNFVYIPSSSILNYLLSKMSTTPVQMKPIFGVISQATLRRLHEQYQHPISLYSNLVKTNLSKPHGYRCGPLSSWLHDVGHSFWFGMLSLAEIDVLFNHVIPLVQTLHDQCFDDSVKDKINHIIEQLNDFDLTPLDRYRDSNNRFINYVVSCFGSNRYYTGLYYDLALTLIYHKIGELIEDHIYFLMYKLLHQLKKDNSSSYNLWHKICLENRPSSSYHVDVASAIESVVENVYGVKMEYPASSIDLVDRPENLTDLKSFLTTTADSKAIWNYLIENHHDYLLQLIVKKKLKFFEPHIPLCTEEYQRLVNIIDKAHSHNIMCQRNRERSSVGIELSDLFTASFDILMINSLHAEDMFTKSDSVTPFGTTAAFFKGKPAFAHNGTPHGLFMSKEFLIKYRHCNDELQHEYDKRFGLIRCDDLHRVESPGKR